jgi:hypothetical protein
LNVIFSSHRESHHGFIHGNHFANFSIEASATRVIMQSPSIVRLLLLTVGLAVGIATLAGKPAVDGYHNGLWQTRIVANR